MKIICVGHAAYDITIPLDKFVLENTKNRVDELCQNGGGPAATAAYLLGKWGMDVAFAGVVGNDLYGKKIKEEFENVNVRTKYLEMNKNFATTLSFIVANKSNGSRTILTYRPKEMVMKDIKLDFKPDIILLDGQEVEISKKLLMEYPDAISIIDAGRATDDIIELAQMVNYVVCSKEFAETVTGITIDYNNFETISNLYQEMKDIFGTNIVVTLEAKGALYQVEDKVRIMPSLKVQAIDSTGAGDIFHGAFTYGLAKGYDLEKTIKIANLAGAVSVTKLGSRNSILTIEEMQDISDEFR